jgi:hypothetical protein
MTYEMLEATLVNKIADLRKAEANFDRSLRAAKNGIRIDLDAAHRRLQTQMNEVEQLLAQINETTAYTVPMNATPQFSPLAIA